MKIGNSYLVSLVHERSEASYHNSKKQIREIKSLQRFYNDDPHLFAINIELYILKKLMQATKREDNEDFSRRYKARVRDLKKLKSKLIAD